MITLQIFYDVKEQSFSYLCHGTNCEICDNSYEVYYHILNYQDINNFKKLSFGLNMILEDKILASIKFPKDSNVAYLSSDTEIFDNISFVVDSDISLNEKIDFACWIEADDQMYEDTTSIEKLVNEAGYIYQNNIEAYYPPAPHSSSVVKWANSMGLSYNESLEKFIAAQPYPSWVLNETTYDWEAPVAMPANSTCYDWVEETLSWVASDQPAGTAPAIDGG